MTPPSSISAASLFRDGVCWERRKKKRKKKKSLAHPEASHQPASGRRQRGGGQVYNAQSDATFGQLMSPRGLPQKAQTSPSEDELMTSEWHWKTHRKEGRERKRLGMQCNTSEVLLIAKKILRRLACELMGHATVYTCLEPNSEHHIGTRIYFDRGSHLQGMELGNKLSLHRVAAIETAKDIDVCLCCHD